jgi:hypothetical protein
MYTEYLFRFFLYGDEGWKRLPKNDDKVTNLTDLKRMRVSVS